MSKYLFWGLLLQTLVMIYGCKEPVKEVKIGTQTWMSKNLNVKKFRNGDPIPEARSEEEWIRASELGKPAWCSYDNTMSNDKKYGKLYNWHAVNDSRGLAPDGWHIPSDKEWNLLHEYLGGNDLVGEKLKASLEGWANVKKSISRSGFEALPGGYRQHDGFFSSNGDWATWWSSTMNPAGLLEDLQNDRSFVRQIWSFAPHLLRDDEPIGSGFSVRCIKNSTD